MSKYYSHFVTLLLTYHGVNVSKLFWSKSRFAQKLRNCEKFVWMPEPTHKLQAELYSKNVYTYYNGLFGCFNQGGNLYFWYRSSSCMFKQVHSGWPKAIQSIRTLVNTGPANFLCLQKRREIENSLSHCVNACLNET